MWILKILMINLSIVFVTEILLGFFIGARNWRKIITIGLINIITNPAVVLSSMCLTIYFEKWQYIGVWILEVLAFLIEGIAFLKFKTFGEKNPYIVSFALNFTSFIAGELIEILL